MSTKTAEEKAELRKKFYEWAAQVGPPPTGLLAVGPDYRKYMRRTVKVKFKRTARGRKYLGIVV